MTNVDTIIEMECGLYKEMVKPDEEQQKNNWEGRRGLKPNWWPKTVKWESNEVLQSKMHEEGK